MDLFSLVLLTHENNEIESPTKIYDFTVLKLRLIVNRLLNKVHILVHIPHVS